MASGVENFSELKVVEMRVVWYNNSNIVTKGVPMRKRVREIGFDVDAYTGGFNLQIAYSTGYVAGMQEC